jgi:hypothetical protein
VVLNIKNLTGADFPGIDYAKFNEWKALKLRSDREQRIVSYIAIGIWLIGSLLFTESKYPSIFIITFMIVGYGVYRAKTKRLRQLGKELKMSDRLWAKKKGRVFTE